MPSTLLILYRGSNARRGLTAALLRRGSPHSLVMATGDQSETLAASFPPVVVQLRPLPAFEFDNPSTWPRWLLQYEDYLFDAG